MCGVAVLRNALHTRQQRTQVRKEHIRMLPKELVSQKEPFSEGSASVVAAGDTLLGCLRGTMFRRKRRGHIKIDTQLVTE